MTAASGTRNARAAIFGTFFANGFVLAAWVTEIPSVAQTTGTNNGLLGTLLLLMGAGSVVGMQGSGFLASRVGSRLAVGIGGVLLAVGAIVLGLASNPVELGAGLIVLGLGNGCIDVAMNDEAVYVERLYDRPIMAAFHATFSVGGAVGAGFGALLHVLNASPLLTLGSGAAVTVAVLAISIPFLPKRTEVTGTAPEAAETSYGRRRVLVRGLALASLAFAFMLGEGAVNDWSAIHAVQHLGQSSAAASLAYVVFAAAMTLGRFTADRVARAAGPRRVVRFGAAIAIVGLTLVVSSPLYALTLLGWGVFGIGISGIVPQIFTAAGALGSGNKTAIYLSRVVTVGYVGMLAGPAVIGWIATGIGINFALLLPLVLCALGVVLAGMLPRSAVEKQDELATRRSVDGE